MIDEGERFPDEARMEEEENREGRSSFFVKEMMDLMADMDSAQEEERQKCHVSSSSESDLTT